MLHRQAYCLLVQFQLNLNSIASNTARSHHTATRSNDFSYKTLQIGSLRLTIMNVRQKVIRTHKPNPGAIGKVTAAEITFKQKLKNVVRFMKVTQLRLTVAANVKFLTMNASEANAFQALLATQAAVCERVECAAPSKTEVMVNNCRHNSRLNVCHIDRRLGEVEFVTASWLFVAAMIILATHHGITALHLGDRPRALGTKPTILRLPQLVCLKLLMAGNCLMQDIISSISLSCSIHLTTVSCTPT
mmetsp:Transcript_11980/g.22445  ORF Transcript_11980/g.22445 Transcript_11980/m.22445 type:complete len:246 (-) Transcript_11980:1073-1810(-)